MTEKALGRIGLKKIRVERKTDADPGPISLPSMVVFMGIAPDLQDAMIRELGDRAAIGLDKEHLEPKDFRQPNQRIIIIDRKVIGRGVSRACRIARSSSVEGTCVIIIINQSYQDLSRAQTARVRFDADICIPYPTRYNELLIAIDQAIEQRRSFASLNLLPRDAATTIDGLERELNRGTYYDLLGSSSQDEVHEIKTLFRKLSRMTHPDRHGRIKAANQVAYLRLQKIHKRLTEAHSVLCHPRRRAIYNMCLRRKGALRYVPDDIPDRAQRELGLCQTEDAKDAVAQCLEARSIGDWIQAERSIRRAVECEPSNEELRTLLAVISHIRTIAEDEAMPVNSQSIG